MGVCVDAVLYDELDASVACGSGVIAVAGPPGSGKTTYVLDYLSRREQQAQQQQSWRLRSAATSGASFCVEYVTAKGAHGDVLSLLVHRLLLLLQQHEDEHEDDTSSQQQQQLRPLSSRRRGVRRRLRARDEYTSLDLADGVVQWCEAYAPSAAAAATTAAGDDDGDDNNSGSNSELHLVVDDADVLDADAAGSTATTSASSVVWLSSSCLDAAARRRCTVCVWLLSQLPLRLHGCFRYHVLRPPTPATVLQWLQAHVDAYKRDNDDNECSSSNTATTTRDGVDDCGRRVLSASQTHALVAQAVQFYRTHLPMSASVVCKDVQRLLHRVYALLPTLLAQCDNATASTAPLHVPMLNSMQLATAWHAVSSGGSRRTAYAKRTRHDALDHHNVDGTRDGDDDDEAAAAACGDALVVALLQMSYSAALLAFAAFYCGAVPQRRQLQALATQHTSHKRTAARRGGAAAAAVTSTTTTQSHKAAVLSSTAHVVTTSQLRFVYDALRRVCVTRLDALEFARAEAAVPLFVDALVAWGLLTPTLDTRSTLTASSAASYHCYMAVTTALQLGRALGLSLYDLIPV